MANELIDGEPVILDLGIQQQPGFLYYPEWQQRDNTLRIMRTQMVRVAPGEPRPQVRPEQVWSGAAPSGHPDESCRYRVVRGKLVAGK